MKKRMFTVFLSVCMILEFFVYPTEAASISDTEYLEEKLEQTEEIQKKSNGEIATMPLLENGIWEYYEKEDGTLAVTKYCGSQEDIVIPGIIDNKTVTEIGYSSYKFEVSDKSKVRSISIPSVVETIAWKAFEGFSSMTEFYSLGNLDFTDLARALEGCSALTTIHYGGEGAVDLCDIDGPITTIYFLEGVESVNIYNYKSSSGDEKEEYLTAVHLPATVKNVWLSNLKNLQSVTFPDSVEKFGFRDCPNLSAIDCSKPIIEMDADHIENCPNLHIEVSVKSNGMPNINNAGITKLVIDGNVWGIYAWNKSFEQLPDLQEIVVTGTNEFYFVRDGVLFWRRGRDDPYCDLIAYPAGKNAGSDYTVPEDVRCIYYNAFNSCKCTSIIIPENISEEWYWDSNNHNSSMIQDGDLSFLGLNQAKLSLVPGSCIASDDTEQDVAEKLNVSEDRIQFRFGNTYQIFYELNGGINAVGNPVSYRAGEYIKLKNPTKEGYRFLGWRRNDIGADEETGEIPYIDTVRRHNGKFQNYTFTACWEKISSQNPVNPISPVNPEKPENTQKPENPDKQDQETVTIIFDGNGGKNLGQSSVTLKKNQMIGSMPPVQRKGYIFKGWYTEKIGGVKVSYYARVTKSQTLYARWEKVKKPKKAVISSLKKRGSRKFFVKYRKITGAEGYQICYSTNKKFKSSTRKVYTKSLSRTVKGLKKNKRYYVRVRAYKVDSTGSKIYGSFSKTKKSEGINVNLNDSQNTKWRSHIVNVCLL